MQFTNEHEEDTRFKDDQIFRAKLEEIKLHTFEWRDRDGDMQEGRILHWWWVITSSPYGPVYVGRKVKGETPAKLTNREDNKFRIWSESLLGREIPVGMGVDTDDLAGLEADILIKMIPDRKDPKKSWATVDGIAPADSMDEPPF